MNSSENMDSSQSDVSMREDEYRQSDEESQNSERSPRIGSFRHGHLSSTDRYENPFLANDPLNAARREFNKNRKIVIKNVPPVQYQEVKDFLGSYAVSNISISKRARHAVATLIHGDEAECATSELNGRSLMGTAVNVSIYPNECLLCVAHLPLNLDATDFYNMVVEYGAIERAFLMLNKEGRSKGYGFVEFAHNKELSTQARNLLDGKRMGSCTLHCDFLDTSIVSFEHLQSRCLFIDHLPQGYDNEMELRNIFSFNKTPTFFRLHTAGNNGQNRTCGSFAVVEYENYHVAEDTQQQSNGLLLRSQHIRVTFCLPGRPGIDIFSTLLAAHTNSSKQALLPNPTSTATAPTRDSLTNPLVFNLLAQNPLLLQNFQKMLQQLHQQTQPPTQKPGLLGVAPSLPNSPLMNPNLQVALLAVMIAMQLQQFDPSLIKNRQLQAMLNSNLQNEQNSMGGGTRPSLLGNPMIAQANSLLQNLAAQPGSSIVPNTVPVGVSGVNGNVGNLDINQLNNWNQLLGLIQTHLGGIPDSSGRDKQDSSPLNSGQGLLGDAPASFPMGKGPLLGVGPGMNMKPGLLGDAPLPGSVGRPILGKGHDSDNQALLGHDLPRLPADQGAKENINVGPANPLLAIFIEGQIRQQLDFLQGPGGPGPNQGRPIHSQAPVNPRGPPQPPLGGPGQRPLAQRRPPRPSGPTSSSGSLLGQPHFMLPGRMPPPPPPNTSIPPPPLPPGQKPLNKALLPDPINPLSNQMNTQIHNAINKHMSHQYNTHTNSQMSAQISHPHDNQTNQRTSNPYDLPLSGPTQKPGLLGEHPSAALNDQQWQPEGNSSRNMPAQSGPRRAVSEKRGLLGDAPSNLQALVEHPERYSSVSDTSSQYWSENVNHSQGSRTSTSLNEDWGQGLWENNSSMELHQSKLVPSIHIPLNQNSANNSGMNSPAYQQQYPHAYPQIVSQYSQALLPGRPSETFNMLPPKTPVIGSKRSRPHLLPSPEASPEGTYVGQHSQGLGGHYATSYIKKRRII